MEYLVMFGLVVLSIYLFGLGISVAKLEVERDALANVMRSTPQTRFVSEQLTSSWPSGFLVIVLLLLLVMGYLLVAAN